jgi:hypothetical protein
MANWSQGRVYLVCRYAPPGNYLGGSCITQLTAVLDAAVRVCLQGLPAAQPEHSVSCGPWQSHACLQAPQVVVPCCCMQASSPQNVMPVGTTAAAPAPPPPTPPVPAPAPKPSPSPKHVVNPTPQPPVAASHPASTPSSSTAVMATPMEQGQRMPAGRCLVSPNQMHKLCLQTGGKLVSSVGIGLVVATTCKPVHAGAS